MAGTCSRLHSLVYRRAMADRALDYLKEQIKFETELLKLATLVAVAVGGGSLSLLLGELSRLRLGLAGFGFLATMGLALAVWHLHHSIRRLTAQIQESL